MRFDDIETLDRQLRKYVLEPLMSAGFGEAARTAMNATANALAKFQAADERERHPRITDNLGKLHRRYRRRS